MKISSDPHHQVTAQPVDRKADQAEAGAVDKKTSDKKLRKQDTVHLSASLDTELLAREAGQARRVAKLKSLVESVKYKVDSTEVAKKILSGG